MPRRRTYQVKAKKDSWFGKILIFTPIDFGASSEVSIVRKRTATSETWWPFKTTFLKKGGKK